MKKSIFILGSFNVDLVSHVDEFPLPGQTIQSVSCETSCGGKGANQAYAASVHDVNVSFLCKLGRDAFADFAREQLSARTQQKSLIISTPSFPTGVANINVRNVDKENTIVLNLGSNKSFTKQDILSVQHEIMSSDIVMVQLENNLDAIAHVLQIAKSASVRTLLNPAPFNPSVFDLLPYVDIITPNESELEALTQMPVNSLDQTKAAAKFLSEQYQLSTILVTRGSRGALCYHEYHFLEVANIQAKAMDTTGAGDAFNGAFAAKLIEQNSIEEAAQYANAFASLAVEKKGASNIPTQQEALNRLSQFQ